MPIKDYNDDAAMAKLGRETARRSAAKKHRMDLRDTFVKMENAQDVERIKEGVKEFVAIAKDLIEALELE